MKYWLWLLLTAMAVAQPNYDEGLVPEYRLPELTGQSREQLLELFAEHVYGRAPGDKPSLTASESSETVFAGKAVRTLVELELAYQGRHQSLHLLIYRPARRPSCKVFVAMNFMGNQTVYPDSGIPLAQGWVDNNESLGITQHQATDSSRGGRSGRWPVEAIVARGYGLCTLYYGDVDPDFDDGFTNGVHGLMGKSDDWGSIAAWAWGLSRVADYLEGQDWVEGLAVMGHSRLGKAALWAGANDPRFGLVISNNSGCGGAALSRRRFGETVKAINDRFPHWFSRRFREYNEREDALPVDQHQLLALMAPRLLYVASAESDLWADPKGEQLAVEAARPAFTGGGAAGYHVRPGKHDVTPYDWERYLDFADRWWRPQAP